MRMWSSTVLAVLVVAPASLASRSADACTLLAPYDYMPEPLMNDTMPPGAPILDYVVKRIADDDSECGDRAYIGLGADAVDDQVPDEDLGYLLEVVTGEPPRGIDLEGPLGGPLFLYFDHDAPGFAFTLSARAVDRNGNIGPATTIDIVGDDPPGGCSTTAGPSSAGLALALLALRRRR